MRAKNPVCWNWFLQFDFSKIIYRSTGEICTENYIVQCFFFTFCQTVVQNYDHLHDTGSQFKALSFLWTCVVPTKSQLIWNRLFGSLNCSKKSKQKTSSPGARAKFRKFFIHFSEESRFPKVLSKLIDLNFGTYVYRKIGLK